MDSAPRDSAQVKMSGGYPSICHLPPFQSMQAAAAAEKPVSRLGLMQQQYCRVVTSEAVR